MHGNGSTDVVPSTTMSPPFIAALTHELAALTAVAGPFMLEFLKLQQAHSLAMVQLTHDLAEASKASDYARSEDMAAKANANMLERIESIKALDSNEKLSPGSKQAIMHIIGGVSNDDLSQAVQKASQEILGTVGRALKGY